MRPMERRPARARRPRGRRPLRPSDCRASRESRGREHPEFSYMPTCRSPSKKLGGRILDPRRSALLASEAQRVDSGDCGPMNGSSSSVTTTMPSSVTVCRRRSSSRLKPIIAPRGISTSRSMMARLIRACRPTRTPGMRIDCSIVQKLWTRTFGHRMLPEIRLPDTMQPGEISESSASPRRPSSANTNFAGGACG